MVTLEESKSRKAADIQPKYTLTRQQKDALRFESWRGAGRTLKKRTIGGTTGAWSTSEDTQRQEIAMELHNEPFAPKLAEMKKATGYRIEGPKDYLWKQRSAIEAQKQRLVAAERARLQRQVYLAMQARQQIVSAQESERQRQARINKWVNRLSTLNPRMSKRQRANLRETVEWSDREYQTKMRKFEAGTQEAYQEGIEAAEELTPGTKIYEWTRKKSRDIRKGAYKIETAISNFDTKYIQKFDKELSIALQNTGIVLGSPQLFPKGVQFTRKNIAPGIHVGAQAVGNVVEFGGMVPGGVDVMLQDVGINVRKKDIVPSFKKPKIIGPALRAGAREATVGMAEAFTTDPVQTSADIAASLLIFGAVGKASPIKTARVPTKKGTYHGAYLDLPGYKKGIAGFEGITPKTPKKINVLEGYTPKTPGETALSMSAILKNFPSATKSEFIAGLKLSRILKSEKATTLKELRISDVKYIPRKANAIVRNWLKSETSKGGYIFGSATQKVQLRAGRLIKDIDFATKGNPTKAARDLAQQLKRELGYENVQQSGNVVKIKIDGKFHHAIDVHAISDLRGYFGFGAKGKKPIKIGEYKYIQLSEQFQRKATSSLTPRGKTFGPAEWRGKDIIDFVTIANELIEEGLHKASKNVPVLKQVQTVKYLEAQKQFHKYLGIKELTDIPNKIKEISLEIDKTTKSSGKSYFDDPEIASYTKSRKSEPHKKYGYSKPASKKQTYAKSVQPYTKSKPVSPSARASATNVRRPPRYTVGPSKLPKYFPDLPLIYNTYSYLSKYPYPKATPTKTRTPYPKPARRSITKPSSSVRHVPRKLTHKQLHDRSLREWRENNPIPTLNQILGSYNANTQYSYNQSKIIRTQKTINKTRR